MGSIIETHLHSVYHIPEYYRRFLIQRFLSKKRTRDQKIHSNHNFDQFTYSFLTLINTIPPTVESEKFFLKQ
jgi:CRISPR/Cas system endoribonuclease Cas6 (RAMP superfamily)